MKRFDGKYGRCGAAAGVGLAAALALASAQLTPPTAAGGPRELPAVFQGAHARVTHDGAIAVLELQGKQRARYSRDAELVSAIWNAETELPVHPPKGTPDWRLTVWQGRDTRTFEGWRGSEKLALREVGHQEVCAIPNVLVRRLQLVSRVPRIAATPSEVEAHASLRPVARQISVDELQGAGEYLTYGHVVAWLGSYYEHPVERRGQENVYLFKVTAVIKSRGERQLDFLQVRWPGDVMGESAVRPGPLPNRGDSFILSTTRSSRTQYVRGVGHERWMGEHRVSLDSPFTAVRIVDGRTAPMDPDDPGDPEVGFLFPERIPLYDQPVDAFVEFMRWGLQPEQRFGKGRPLPGPAGRKLKRVKEDGSE